MHSHLLWHKNIKRSDDDEDKVLKQLRRINIVLAIISVHRLMKLRLRFKLDFHVLVLANYVFVGMKSSLFRHSVNIWYSLSNYRTILNGYGMSLLSTKNRGYRAFHSTHRTFLPAFFILNCMEAWTWHSFMIVILYSMLTYCIESAALKSFFSD